jgi:methyl-accepting chemotaxis protein
MPVSGGEQMAMGLKLRVLIPGALGLLIVGGVATLGATVLTSKGQLDDLVAFANKAQDEQAQILDLSTTAANIRRLIIHTQETLTDISATRALIGFDGYDTADAAAKEFAADVAHLNELGEALKSDELVAKAKELSGLYKTFYATGMDMARAYVAQGTQAGNVIMKDFDKRSDLMQDGIDQTRAIVDSLVDSSRQNLKSRIDALDTRSSTFARLMYAAMAGFLLIGAVFSLFIIRWACNPLTRMTDYMSFLAAGDYSKPVPDTHRRDEIGAMATAVEVFRGAVLERQASRKADETRRLLEIEKERAAAAEKASEDARRQHVIERLNDALMQLSSGDLTVKINEPFDQSYEVLRARFNDSVAILSDSIAQVMKGAAAVQAGSHHMTVSSSELARRTERQAATIEEAAAAIEEISVAVRNSTSKASDAAAVMAETRKSAEASAQVVTRAVSAMRQIAESSNEIGSIINLIDTIAFQTNLLALNAGVEAARAGEAGKGFAVVAQEVRDLASRSAHAAKDIKALIQASSDHVNTGVDLVNSTGASLEDIHRQVIKVGDLIEEIATASREQASAIAEVNASVNEMDQVTQQNAAMAEENSNACVGLNDEAKELEMAAGRFVVVPEAGASRFSRLAA